MPLPQYLLTLSKLADIDRTKLSGGFVLPEGQFVLVQLPRPLAFRKDRQGAMALGDHSMEVQGLEIQAEALAAVAAERSWTPRLAS